MCGKEGRQVIFDYVPLHFQGSLKALQNGSTVVYWGCVPGFDRVPVSSVGWTVPNNWEPWSNQTHGRPRGNAEPEENFRLFDVLSVLGKLAPEKMRSNWTTNMEN